MKEQTQQPGVRKWAGDDMIALQAEPLSAIQGFFKEYGNCIIQGCATTPAAGGKFNIAPGLLALSGMDADGEATFKVVPFSGVENVTLPLYFTLTHSVIDRVYGDGKVKPIAYDYRAAVSAVRPAAGVEFLELTTAGGRRFVDAVKITEKLDKVGNGKDVTVTFAQATTRENIASGEKLTIILGKIIRWLADLKALAFKDKVSKADMDTALQGELDGKLNLSGGTMTGDLYIKPGNAISKAIISTSTISSETPHATFGVSLPDNTDASYICIGSSKSQTGLTYHDTGEFNRYKTIWHSGNFNPATKEPVFTKNSAFNKNFGTAAGTVCKGDDARLSDARPANGGNADSSFFNKINIVDNDDLSVPTGNQQLQAFITRGIGAAREGGDGYILAQKYHSQCCTQLYIDADPTYNIALRQSDAAGKWNAWKKFAFTSDIPASLPANGGDADTVKSIAPAGVGQIGYEQMAVYNNVGQLKAAFFQDNAPIEDQHIIGAVGYKISQADGFHRFCSLARFRQVLAALPIEDNIRLQYYDALGGRWIEQKILDYPTVGLHFNRSIAAGMWSQLDAYTRGSDGYKKRMEISESGGRIQGNLTLDTSNASYVALNRNNVNIGYMGLGNTTKKDLLFQLYQSGNFIRIGEDGKNYSNNKEIATIDQIKTLSGGAAPTAGQYVSGIAVNDHEITVIKAALPTTDLGGIGANGVNWDTFTTPGANWTNSMGWGTNAPNTNNMNGLLIVSRSGNCIVQCYEPSDATGAFKRVKPIDGYWSDWKQCAMKSDFNTANIAESANKRFMSDAQEAKLDGGLEVAFAGVVDADGGILKSKGRQFNVQKNDYGLFTVTHGENDAFLIVQVMSEGGQVSIAHTFTSRTFKVASYAGAGGNTNGRGFRIVAYKL